MKIYNSIQEFSAPRQTIVTLGTFDGVHKGHKSILEKLKNSSKETGCQSVVLTFFPHPRMVLQQADGLKLLNTMDEKAYLLELFGIDNLIIHPFSKEFSRLTAEEFVKEVLVDRLNTKKIIIGYDHRFGRNRTADINDLIRFGAEYGFEVAQISALEVEEVSVSSTKIRNALNEGLISKANRYLGYPYFITGKVTTGKQLGRTIGFPTANIKLTEDYKLVPAHGVYAASAQINGTTVLGMMNIGMRPTVDGTTETIEVHFFDFSQDIYGAQLRISLHHRLRFEQKFAGIDALREQLDRDRIAAKEYFKQTGL